MPIEREIRFVTAGSSTSTSQVFYNNYLADSTPVATEYFSFYKPGYYTYGGTLDYYGQDPYTIFTNLSNPPIRFKFTAHTESLTGDSYFIHEIYKLEYDIYKLYSDNQIARSQELITKVDEAIGSNFPPIPFPSSLNKNFSNSNEVGMGNNAIPVPEKFFGQPLTLGDKSTIQNYFSNPLITITASTSAITGTIYDLVLEEYVKKLGNYKDEFFTSKGQYFINTKMVFNVDLNKDYTNFYTIKTGETSGITETIIITAATFVTGQTIGVNGPDATTTITGFEGVTITGVTIITGVTSSTESIGVNKQDWDNTLKIEATNNYLHTIKIGPFAGINVIGNYFTYFIVPDKPVMEYPIMQGQLTTFTPEFRWSNGDKADSFIVQINYDITNTGFTGSSVINYPVEKSEKNAQVIRSKTKGPTDESETEKTTYNFQLPMKSNKSFLWRVGNQSELIDVFDVRRVVATFSDYYSAISQSQPVKTYVVTESDSPHISEVAGFGTPPSLDYESEIAEYTLSGTVSGSTVTGATIQLTYPNSAYTITVTNLYGEYAFTGLEAGIYTLTTNYRGYQQDVRAINITSNTVENFKIHLLWDNDVDTWGKMAGESYYT